MHRTKTAGPKDPCSSCAIGVKYSSIKCTGPCHLWFHGGCVNITDKHLKKLTKDEIKNWLCTKCFNISEPPMKPKTSNDSSDTTELRNKRNLDNPKIYDTDMIEITTKIKDFENQDNTDLDMLLTLAAEVGNALLIENQKLKADLHQMSLENHKLTTRSLELGSKNEPICEEQIAQLEMERDHTETALYKI